ncbi:pyridoxamine 5'-phosphate oxidase family protein [Pricia sp.]|uniref:pyridoxamine 5'-phosphate oxidase family protein n=1 Tax=Pricia sp. TaxID=2268138 RepID=UPI0035943EFF
MTDTLFQELELELQNGTSKKGHPFRYCTLGTVGLGATARLRTIVLRKVSEDLQLVFYTDRRSKKIGHIKENNTVSLLFYHPKKLVQLKIEGSATLVSDTEELKKYWSGIPPANRKDYTTTSAPGSPISNPDSVEYLEDKNHFAIVEIEPSKIEYLKLQRPNHLRILFSKEDGEWNGSFLVP